MYYTKSEKCVRVLNLHYIFFRSDFTNNPDNADMDRFFDEVCCCICQNPFNFELDYYSDCYKLQLLDRNLYPASKCYGDFVYGVKKESSRIGKMK